MNKTSYSGYFSFIALILSIIALCVALVRSKPYDWDFAGSAITVLGFITAILIAWQIKGMLDYYKEKDELIGQIKDLHQKLGDQKSEAENRLKNIEEKSWHNLAVVSYHIARIYFNDQNYHLALKCTLDGVRFDTSGNMVLAGAMIESIVAKHKKGEIKIKHPEIKASLLGQLENIDKSKIKQWDELVSLINDLG